MLPSCRGDRPQGTFSMEQSIDTSDSLAEAPRIHWSSVASGAAFLRWPVNLVDAHVYGPYRMPIPGSCTNLMSEKLALAIANKAIAAGAKPQPEKTTRPLRIHGVGNRPLAA